MNTSTSYAMRTALTIYGDDYVCFPDEDKGGFAVGAKTKDVERMMAANSKSAKPKLLAEGLVVQTYFKGVSSGQQIFDKVDKGLDEGWTLEFKSPMHGKMVYLINWTTGRIAYWSMLWITARPSSNRDFWQV